MAALAGRTDPRLFVVFVSSEHDLTALLDGIDPGDVPLIGCSTAGEIGADGPGDAGVVVMALGGDGFAVSTAAAPAASTRLRAAGAEVAAQRTRLLELGCRAGQGFVFSRPLDPQAFARLLARPAGIV